jgi:hypothetical protein
MKGYLWKGRLWYGMQGRVDSCQTRMTWNKV